MIDTNRNEFNPTLVNQTFQLPSIIEYSILL